MLGGSRRGKVHSAPLLSERKDSKGRDGEESVRTEMYSSVGSGSGEVKEGVGGEGSSMVLGEGSDDGRGAGGGLLERAERLERARRLWEGGVRRDRVEERGH